MTDPNLVAVVLTVTITVAIIGTLALAPPGSFGDPMWSMYEYSEGWCEDRGGDLYHADSVRHGGLHCELPNGTSVHMSDVVVGSE